MSQLDAYRKQIIAHPLFLQLKTIIENADGWHEYESTYDHSLKTARIAQRELPGNFIVNKKAKKLFLEFMNEKVAGIDRKTVMILAALLHDSGKVLAYKDGSSLSPMLTIPPGQADDQTYFPGHEYFGAEIVVPEILKNLDLPRKVKSYIQTIVRLHGIFNSNSYFSSSQSWSLEELVNDVKARGQGYHIEGLFNAYADCYDAPAFRIGKKRIEELFNSPLLYTKRTYLIFPKN